MKQALFDRDRVHVSVFFRMRERLVNEMELDIFVSIISVDSLQTGDISDERRSGKAPENDDGVLSF